MWALTEGCRSGEEVSESDLAMGRLGPGDLGAMGDDSALGSSGGLMGAMNGEPLTLSLLWLGSTDCKQHATTCSSARCAGPLLLCIQQSNIGTDHVVQLIKAQGLSRFLQGWEGPHTLCRCCNSSCRGDLPSGLSNGVLVAVGRKFVARVNKSRLTDAVLPPSSIMQQPVTQPGTGATWGCRHVCLMCPATYWE